MPASLRSILGQTTLTADGGMGTMLQRYNLHPLDFAGYDGCNEMLNLTHPEIVADIHRAYYEAGADLVVTNTFGANSTALAEYDLVDRLEELAEAGARIARQVGDEITKDCWVLGSVGPGTKLASLGQVSFDYLRRGYHRQVQALLQGGVDAILIETQSDLLSIRAAIVGANQAIAHAQLDCPVFVSVTMETNGRMLVGSDISAVIASLVPLGIDGLGLNCATGPNQMRPHLLELSQASSVPILCMPNAGLPVLTNEGAYYPLAAQDFATTMATYAETFGLAVVGGCCGTTPDHIRALAHQINANQNRTKTERRQGLEMDHGWVSSLYSATTLSQDVAYLAIGERTNAAGSKAFREAMLACDWDSCVEIARGQVNEGAHVLDLCVDYVGRDGCLDMAQLMPRISREIDIPIQIDSSVPEVVKAGLELCGGRAIVNSVSLETGDGPESKLALTMSHVKTHGAAVVGLCIDETGQARSVEAKLAVARRLVSILTNQYGMDESDIIIDSLTYPITTGQSENRRDAANSIEAIRAIKGEFARIHTIAGVSNVSFGLKPSARVVLNSLYLDQCRQAGLDCAIINPAKIRPLSSIPDQQVQAGLDLIWDRWDFGDPLQGFLSLFTETETDSATDDRDEDIPLDQRLRRHILDGAAIGLEDDLRQALATRSGLDIINGDLLEAMREVGTRFGAGKTQLPFVLKSAEVMKQAVRFLEPHMDRNTDSHRGRLVLATVRGDVHDIGKNLVDIILSNNGYDVVNLGTKQSIANIIEAAEAVDADAIGMSGLLVKSTQIMKENLEELNARDLSNKYAVLLGGAALTRSYVEDDLAGIYKGQVRYAHDAFEGLHLMDAVMQQKAGLGQLPPLRDRSTSPMPAPASTRVRADLIRPVPGGVDVPVAPFIGARHSRVDQEEIFPWLDTKALITRAWGVDLAHGEPRLASWIDQLRTEQWLDLQVCWGYWPCYSAGEDLIILDDQSLITLTFPRQHDGEHLCLADYFRDEVEMEQFGQDVIGFQLVTVGQKVSLRCAELFAADAYRDYFELHGLSVQLAEAFAAMWHNQVRSELGLKTLTDDKTAIIRHHKYEGERYSFGYPACPDLEQRRILVDLLKPDSIGVSLSEEFQLHPEQSTDAVIVHHRQARYFSVRSNG